MEHMPTMLYSPNNRQTKTQSDTRLIRWAHSGYLSNILRNLRAICRRASVHINSIQFLLWSAVSAMIFYMGPEVIHGLLMEEQRLAMHPYPVLHVDSWVNTAPAPIAYALGTICVFCAALSALRVLLTVLYDGLYGSGSHWRLYKMLRGITRQLGMQSFIVPSSLIATQNGLAVYPKGLSALLPSVMINLIPMPTLRRGRGGRLAQRRMLEDGLFVARSTQQLAQRINNNTGPHARVVPNVWAVNMSQKNVSADPSGAQTASWGMGQPPVIAMSTGQLTKLLRDFNETMRNAEADATPEDTLMQILAS